MSCGTQALFFDTQARSRLATATGALLRKVLQNCEPHAVGKILSKQLPLQAPRAPLSIADL